MAQAYGDDLRKKLLKAHAAGQGTLRELAARFDVSVAWAWKVSSAQKRTGAAERQPQGRHGASSRVDASVVAALLAAQPDFTLRELQEELKRTSGVQISHTQMWRVVKKLGLRLKKSRSTPSSATRKRTVSGAKRS